jgi:hypothetical protein
LVNKAGQDKQAKKKQAKKSSEELCVAIKGGAH